MGNLSKIIKKHFEVVVLFVLSFIILFLLLYNIVLNYYPTSDDISLMVNSTNIYKPVNPVKWFTVGFEDYFRVYPEWSVHSKEIVRPVANFIFYICGLLFGKNYFYYLFFNIFIHSLGIAFVFYFCRRYLEIGNLFSYLAAVIFLFTPAVTNKDYFLYLSFSLDAAVSIIIFLSFLFAIKNKSLIAFLLTFLALLTKETAMLIPFAVFLTLIVNRKKGKIKYLTIAFLIVVIWLLYKKLFDIGITAGIFNDIAGMWMMYLANILRGLFVWPSGIPDGDLSNVYLVLFVTTLNLVFIAFIFFDGYREYKSKNEKYLIAFFWSIASILIILFFGLYSRFGYAYHLFSII